MDDLRLSRRLFLAGAPAAAPALAAAPNLIGLFEDRSSAAFGAAAPDIVFTSGYSTIGRGAARYRYDTSVDAAFVAANPRWSFRSSGGRGYRLDNEQRILITMFGAAGEYVDDANPGTDNYPAWLAFKAFAAWLGNNTNTQAGSHDFYDASPTLYIPFAKKAYYSSGTWVIKENILHIRGEGSGEGGEAASAIKFAAGRHGIVLDRANTANGTAVTGSVPLGKGSDGSSIRYLGIFGSSGSGMWHGIHMRNHNSGIYNCKIASFPGDGIHIYASAGAVATGEPEIEGNANNWRVRDTSCIFNGRAGIWVQGADANAGSGIGVDCSYNGRYGIVDKSFLGNTWVGCHCEYNGVPFGGSNPGANTNITSQVSHNGHLYFVREGQEAGVSTNPPSGTTADNSWWIYYTSGGPSAGYYPAWYSGIPVQHGAPYFSLGGNAPTIFLGCYSEGSQPAAIFHPPTIVLGGLFDRKLGGGHLQNFGGLIGSSGGFSARVDSGQPTQYQATLESGQPGTSFLSLLHPDHPSGWGLKSESANIIFNYGGGGVSTAFGVTGPSHARPYTLFVPNGIIKGSVYETVGTAAPTTGAWGRGDYVRNSAPAVGQPKGWVCTTSGTPGTWVSEGNL